MARYSLSTHTRRIFLALAYIGLATGLIGAIGYLVSIMPDMTIPIGVAQVETINFTGPTNIIIAGYSVWINITFHDLEGAPNELMRVHAANNATIRLVADHTGYFIDIVVYINGSRIGCYEVPMEECIIALTDDTMYMRAEGGGADYHVISTGIVMRNITLAVTDPEAYGYVTIQRSPPGIDLKVIVVVAAAIFPLLLYFKAARLLGVNI